MNNPFVKIIASNGEIVTTEDDENLGSDLLQMQRENSGGIKLVYCKIPIYISWYLDDQRQNK